MKKAHIVCFILIAATLKLASCSKTQGQPDPGIFRQDLYNYGFVRFENNEVICYKYGSAGEGSISCKWKD